MLKIVSRDLILGEKLKRREKLPLEYHAHGDCIHIGKISSGCRTCFVRNNFSSFAVYTGCECNVSCGYCYYDKKRNDDNWNSHKKIRNNLADLYEKILDNNTNFQEITYNSWGETLKYPAIIKEASDMIKRWQLDSGKKTYSHLYTNGMLADEKMLAFLKDCEVSELRFHHSASNFSKKVLDNMQIAVDMDFIVTIEEPSLPENKDKLIKHLEIYDKIGIKHLNLIECQVTLDNKEYLETMYPNGRVYRDNLWHFYDEGMVYDIIEEKVNNNYSFSIIDCNSRVECCRDTNQITKIHEFLDWNMMDEACNKL